MRGTVAFGYTPEDAETRWKHGKLATGVLSQLDNAFRKWPPGRVCLVVLHVLVGQRFSSGNRLELYFLSTIDLLPSRNESSMQLLSVPLRGPKAPLRQSVENKAGSSVLRMG